MSSTDVYSVGRNRRKPSIGEEINAVQVSDRKAQGVTNLSELVRAGLFRPSYLEALSERNANKAEDRRTARGKAIRAVIQRPFDAGRVSNADSYSRYIERIGPEQDGGGTPAITILVPENAFMTEDGLNLVIPQGEPLIALDGETQTEARFLLAERRPESLNWPVAVTFYIGISDDHAKQIVYDYNSFARPMKGAAHLNAHGPLTVIAEAVISGAGILEAKVNHKGEVPGKYKTIAFRQVIAAAAGYYAPEVATVQHTSKKLRDWNRPMDANMPIDIEAAISALLPLLSKEIIAVSRLAPIGVWQIAGVLVKQGFPPHLLNWQAGAARMAGEKSAPKRYANIMAGLRS